MWSQVITWASVVGETLKEELVAGSGNLTFYLDCMVGEKGERAEAARTVQSLVLKVNFKRKQKFTYSLIPEASTINILDFFPSPLFSLCMICFISLVLYRHDHSKCHIILGGNAFIVQIHNAFPF